MAGEVYEVDMQGVKSLPLLTEQAILRDSDWQKILKNRSAATLLCQLIAEGAWFWSEG
jgi:hypothetical protein